jgi:type IV secretion system protein VirB10
LPVTYLSFAITLIAWSPAAWTVDPDRDFNGTWVLDRDASDIGALPNSPDPVLTITQRNAAVQAVAQSGTWSYPTDGTVSRYRAGGAAMSSRTKWEGAALLTNTLVAGPQNYAVMDRWRLSRDRTALTIKRQIVRGTAEAEGLLVYRRKGETLTAGAGSARPPILAERPAHVVPDPITIPAGTRIPLALQNSLSTTHSRDGDRVYLKTVFPVLAKGRVVVAPGSHVAGTVTARRPGRVSGKGELFIRFDSLTLPNGVTREFRSRLENADAGAGSVDRQEGKIITPGGKAEDARRVGEAAGGGAAVGTIAGAAGGHSGMGAGVGAAAGAAAGVASVLLGRGPDTVLRPGTTLEMVLDRDLRFSPDELK